MKLAALALGVIFLGASGYFVNLAWLQAKPFMPSSLATGLVTRFAFGVYFRDEKHFPAKVRANYVISKLLTIPALVFIALVLYFNGDEIAAGVLMLLDAWVVVDLVSYDPISILRKIKREG